MALMVMDRMVHGLQPVRLLQLSGSIEEHRLFQTTLLVPVEPTMVRAVLYRLLPKEMDL